VEYNKLAIPQFLKGKFLYPSFTIKGCSIAFTFGETFTHLKSTGYSSIMNCKASDSSLGSVAASAQTEGRNGWAWKEERRR
jgi:hypothetical protein